jgi:hypothetical protein
MDRFKDDKCTEYYKDHPPRVKGNDIIERMRLIYSALGRGNKEDLSESNWEILIESGIKPEDVKNTDQEQTEKLLKLMCNKWDWMDFKYHVKDPEIRRELENKLEKYEDQFTYREYIDTRDAIRNKQFEQVRKNLEEAKPTEPKETNNSKWWKIWR